jgi:hypothetical protein
MERTLEEYSELLKRVNGKDVLRVYCDIFRAFTSAVESYIEIEKSNSDIVEAVKGSSKYSIPFFDKLSREIDVKQMGIFITVIFRLAAMAQRIFESPLDEKIRLKNEMRKLIDELKGAK